MGSVRTDYIFSPQTLISIVTAVIAGTIAWTSLKSRVEQNSKDIKEIQGFNLNIKITEIQKDVQYMREMLDRVMEQRK